MPLWVTRLILIVSLLGGFLSQDMFPSLAAYKWALAIIGVAAILVNHQVAANSNPDGTPAAVAYQPPKDVNHG
jgi:hypothetical protein